MIKINTISGAKYQDIAINENDFTYGDLLKYIKIPEHSKFREYIESKLDEYCIFEEIIVKTRFKLYSENSREIDYDIAIDYEKPLVIIFNYKYYYNIDMENLAHGLDKFVKLDNALYNVENQTDEICRQYINNQPFSLIFVKNQTRELCEMAIKLRPNAIQCVNNPSVELCEYAIQCTSSNCDLNFENVLPSMRTDKMYKLAVEYWGSNLKYLPDELKTPELCRIAVKSRGDALAYVPENLKTEKLCRIAVKKSGDALAYVPENLKTAALCEMALNNSPYALLHIPCKFLNNKLFKIAIIGRNGQSRGYMLKYIPDEFKTQELCDLAIQSMVGAIKYVPFQYMTNDMCKTVVTRFSYTHYLDHNGTLCGGGYGRLLQYIPAEKQTFEICDIAVKDDKDNIKYVKNKKYKLYNSMCNAYDYVKNYVW